MLGHSGSTLAQPIINELTKLIRKNTGLKRVVGGVFPTFYWREILADNPQIDFIICGEGERTALDLIDPLKNDADPEPAKGLAFRINSFPSQTPSADIIENFDEFRVGWALMKGHDHTYRGKHKAAAIQFSRGCRHSCIYCGQNLFWKKWRHRSP